MEGRKEGRLIGLVTCCLGTVLLKRDIEEKVEGTIEVARRGGRRSKRPLDDFREKTWHWKLKEEAQDRTLPRTGFGRGYGPVVRQTTARMSECMNE